jgi:hypothetical protein
MKAGNIQRSIIRERGIIFLGFHSVMPLFHLGASIAISISQSL